MAQLPAQVQKLLKASGESVDDYLAEQAQLAAELQTQATSISHNFELAFYTYCGGDAQVFYEKIVSKLSPKLYAQDDPRVAESVAAINALAAAFREQNFAPEPSVHPTEIFSFKRATAQSVESQTRRARLDATFGTFIAQQDARLVSLLGAPRSGASYLTIDHLQMKNL